MGAPLLLSPSGGLRPYLEKKKKGFDLYGEHHSFPTSAKAEVIYVACFLESLASV